MLFRSPFGLRRLRQILIGSLRSCAWRGMDSWRCRTTRRCRARCRRGMGRVYWRGRGLTEHCRLSLQEVSPKARLSLMKELTSVCARLCQDSVGRSDSSGGSPQSVLDGMARRSEFASGNRLQHERHFCRFRARYGASSQLILGLSCCLLPSQHRDPDELDCGFSPLAAEERRRIFWGLFSSDT